MPSDLTRVVVQGSTNTPHGWLRLHVDPRSCSRARTSSSSPGRSRRARRRSRREPYARRLTLDPRTASFLRHAAEMTALGRYDDAAGLERQARDAAARAGDAPEALLGWHAQVGRRTFLQARWDEAERALRAAIELAGPGHATPRDRFDLEFRLGLTLQRLERHAEAVAQLERTLALAGGFGAAFEPPPGLRHALAESLRAAGGPDAAAGVEPARATPAPAPRVERPAPPAPPAPPVDDSFDAVFRDVDALIGLAGAKAQFKRLAELLRVNQLRRGHGLRTAGVALHMVFVGGPGTGKTTLARLTGRLYHALELLETADVVEVTRADLVSGFVGQTAQRTNEVIDSALGKVLFIDEAYALARPGSDADFGPEAVAELLKRMEDERSRLAVIIAGYPDEIAAFLTGNPGFASRFGETIVFEDFLPAELARIFVESFCAPSDYRLSPPALAELERICTELYTGRGRAFANARTIRNLFEDAIAAQAQRLGGRGTGVSRDELMTLEPSDLTRA
jgi:stage V sporulation protein K